MADMLINLYEVDFFRENNFSNKIKIKRALAPDRRKVLKFIKNNFNANFVDECKASFSNNPITCYIAVKDKKIIGFICYEATAKNFVGPMGVSECERGIGIGKTLMLTALSAMKEMGYAYAIIGSSSEKNIPFHKKVSHAKVIDSNSLGVYSRMIEADD